MNPSDKGPRGKVRDRQYELEFFAQETALGSKEMFSCLNEFNPQNYVKKTKTKPGMVAFACNISARKVKIEDRR